MSDQPPPITGIIVCLTRCWACQFSEHYDPPERHTWMDQDDAQHAGHTWPLTPEVDAANTCGCWCSVPPEEVARLKRENAELIGRLAAVRHAAGPKP